MGDIDVIDAVFSNDHITVPFPKESKIDQLELTPTEAMH